MGYVSKYRGIDIDQAIEFSKNNADIDEKLSKKAEVLHTHKLSDITGLSDLKVSWDNITGKPSTFPCDGSCGGGGSSSGGDGSGSGTGGGTVTGSVSWGQITGKPSTFTPSAHTHVITDLSNIQDLKVDWSNITNKPENISGGGSGNVSWENIENKPSAFNPTTHYHSWESIENKPVTFAPTAHKHSAADIEGLVQAGEVEWENIKNKPELADKIHTHTISEVIGLDEKLGVMTGVSSKVDVLQGSVDNLQSQVGTVQTTLGSVQGSLGVLQGNVTVLQSDVATNKSDIANLKETVKDIQENGTSGGGGGNVSDSEVIILKDDVTKLKAADIVINQKINGLDTRVTDVEENIESIETDLASMREDVDKVTVDLVKEVDKAIQESEFGEKLDSIEQKQADNEGFIEDVSSSVEELQNELVQLDETLSGVIDDLSEHYYIWQGEDDTIPTLTNEPASAWTTDSDRRKHIGDFYLTSEGYCYKFAFENNIFFWELVQDRYIVPYAKRIEEKSTIFIAKPNDEDVYNPGDLWLNANYSSIEDGVSFNGQNLVCVYGKTEEDTFSIDHWELSSVVSTRDLGEVSNKIDENQKRVILQRKSDLFQESTWRDGSGNLWIYDGLVISVIQEQKLYLLIDKNNYQKESSWIEIGKTLSLTWDNITDKPEFLDNIEGEFQSLSEGFVQLSQLVEDNNVMTDERLNILENESIPSLETGFDEIQELLSDHYYIWQGEDDTIPDLTNEPASLWGSDSLKREHVGDFYLTSEGYCYRFVFENNTFSWKLVHDRYIVPYAKRIEKRSTVFISQPTSDDFYSPGDLWINATYTPDGALEPLYQRAVLVCIYEKEEGEDFDINHWETSEVASLKSVEDVSKKIDDYRTRVILNNKSELYRESTWKDENGNIWIYNGLVVSVINDQKLYLLIDQTKYQYESAWIEIGKTLSLTWDNITDKPEYLDDIDSRVGSLEGEQEYLKEQVQGNYEDLTERINSIENNDLIEVNTEIEEIQELLRDHYYIWQGEDDAVPSLNNEPASSWSDSEKREHLGDFYINTEGYCYRFIVENNTYSWELVHDRYIVPYAKRIDNKSAIFIAKPETEDSYRVGDLWLNASYDEEGVNIDRRTLVCVFAKDEGEEFSIDHWELASIVDHELEEVDAKIEDYRTRVILRRKSELFLEDTWKTSEGNLWIYEGLVVSVLDVEKLYLLINVNNYQSESAWIEIGKTLSLTWDNITDKPELSLADHTHVDYENDISDLEGDTIVLQEEVKVIQETLQEYDNKTIPDIQDNLTDINDALVGQFYIWHGEDAEEPTDSSFPATDWITIDEKDSHLGDFYLTSEGVCYKYIKTEKGRYTWEMVTDKYIMSYAKKIDGKSTIFYDTPTDQDSYKAGDIWVNAVYESESGVRIFNEDIAICIFDKEAGVAFNVEDWQAVMKANDVNLDNTSVKVGVNQTVDSSKTFVDPVYFGPAGTGPTADGTDEVVEASAYKNIYSSISSEKGNFIIESNKRRSAKGETISTEIRNLTGGGIRIAADLNPEFRNESSETQEILIENKYGGDFRVYNDNDKEKTGGAIRISTKTAGTYAEDGTAIEPYKRIGFSLNPDTNTASFYSQKAGVPVENLCDGYAEFAGFDGIAITSRAEAGRQDMTGARFRWIKEDAAGTIKNNLNIDCVSMGSDGKLQVDTVGNITINDTWTVLTDGNYKSLTELEGSGSSINFMTAYGPVMTDGSEDISDKLNKAISDCLGSDQEESVVSTRTLIIPFGTYRLSKPILVQGIHNSTTSFCIEANNSIFICDQGLDKISINPYPALGDEDGNTGSIDNNHLEAIKVDNYLFTIGEDNIGSAKKDKGLFEFKNAVIRPSSNNISTWGCIDIAGQDSIAFNNIIINNFCTAIRAKNCTNNPTITRCKFDGDYIGFRSLGNIHNLTIEDCSFTNTGTAIYLDKNSILGGEFANNIISHCAFIGCTRGIFGNAPGGIKSFNIKCNKFDNNGSAYLLYNDFDIFLKNYSEYAEIPVTFVDIEDEDGNVVPWPTRSSIEIVYPNSELISPHLIGYKESVDPNTLSSVIPIDSSVGTTHEAIYIKAPESWGDCNISISDNIFYSSEGIRVGNNVLGKHISGVMFNGNKVTSKTENTVRICSDLPKNCSAISVFGNSYESEKRDQLSGEIIAINIEAPITSSLLKGNDYMPAGGLMARYSAVPEVPVTSDDESGQVGDLRWDETKAYLKTETGWKVIQFTHEFNNESQSVPANYKFMEIGSQAPGESDIDKYNAGDIVWNFGGDGRTLGWRLVEISGTAKPTFEWKTLEELIKDQIG